MNRFLFGSVLLWSLLIFIVPVAAQENSVYGWAEADLALVYPAGWDSPVTAADGDAVTLTLSGGERTITLTVLAEADDDSALRPALEAQLAALNLLPLEYALDTVYGRRGLRIDAVSADRTLIGVGRSGLLPDNRALLVVGRAEAADRAAFEDDLRLVLDSIVFSADLPPMTPTYRPVWSLPAGDQPVGWVAAADGRLYVLESVGVQLLTELDGVRVLDAATGAVISQYPFEHPANPTGIAVDAAGIVYVGDTVCRCVRRMNAQGQWLDPVGSFGGNAPFSLAVAADGTIYATDKTDAGYALRILGEPVNRTVGLNFNASAPPLVTLDRAGQAWVVEWLGSMIDGTVSGAVSLVDVEKRSAELRFWLETLTPEAVNALTTSPAGDLVVATIDRGILFVHSSGTAGEALEQEIPARSLAFNEDGTIFTVQTDGVLHALNTDGVPDRAGGRVLALGVPVQGTLDAAVTGAENEDVPQQSWTYAGTAGERITISAVDQTRTDAATLGLDMALRLTAPDGSEVAYNDDQLGADLFGIYDAQIAEVMLPQSGDYTITVEGRQGSGVYTLGVSAVRALELSAEGVTQISGRLQDVFPVERWAFAGHEGDVLTFTMTAESGTLDPALLLRQPDGELLAYNDDASDLQLEINAQLTQVRLPIDGTYLVEASRFVGAGNYMLVIVSTVHTP